MIENETLQVRFDTGSPAVLARRQAVEQGLRHGTASWAAVAA